MWKMLPTQLLMLPAAATNLVTHYALADLNSNDAGSENSDSTTAAAAAINCQRYYCSRLLMLLMNHSISATHY
jgi:hypothetical protein